MCSLYFVFLNKYHLKSLKIVKFEVILIKKEENVKYLRSRISAGNCPENCSKPVVNSNIAACLDPATALVHYYPSNIVAYETGEIVKFKNYNIFNNEAFFSRPNYNTRRHNN